MGTRVKRKQGSSKLSGAKGSAKQQGGSKRGSAKQSSKQSAKRGSSKQGGSKHGGAKRARAKPSAAKGKRAASTGHREALEHEGESTLEGVLAAIDVGTNAVRLKLARVLPDGSFDALHQERDPVRPGEGVFQTGMMQRPVADRLVAALKQYAAICRRHRARVRCVATSALREAKNRDEIVARVKRETGLELDVISGKEEARLICLGVLRGMPRESRSLLVDIGGGSTELARAVGEEPVELFSAQLGAVRVTELFDLAGKVTRDRLVMARRFAQRVVEEALPVSLGSAKHALGSSGTIRAIVAFAAQPGTAHAKREHLTRAVEELVNLGPAGRRKRMDASRADIIVAGGVILEAVAHHLKLESITAIDGGLKEGLLVDLVRRSHTRHSDPLLTEAIVATGRRFSFDEPQALHVGRLALKLFDDLERLHQLAPEARMVLEVAAVLHDVGAAINRVRLHKHTQYVIANTELPGLSDHERLIASLIGRFHGRSLPRAGHPALEALSSIEVRAVRKLVTLLRLADACDPSHDQALESIDAHVRGDVVHLRLHPKKNAALEMWEADHDKALFFSVFHKRLDIVVAR